MWTIKSFRNWMLVLVIKLYFQVRYLCVLQSSAPRRWVDRAWRRRPRPPLLQSLRGPPFWVLLLQLVNLKVKEKQTQCLLSMASTCFSVVKAQVLEKIFDHVVGLIAGGHTINPELPSLKLTLMVTYLSLMNSMKQKTVLRQETHDILLVIYVIVGSHCFYKEFIFAPCSRGSHCN